jgi:hypothetical protein
MTLFSLWLSACRAIGDAPEQARHILALGIKLLFRNEVSSGIEAHHDCPLEMTIPNSLVSCGVLARILA